MTYFMSVHEVTEVVLFFMLDWRLAIVSALAYDLQSYTDEQLAKSHTNPGE